MVSVQIHLRHPLRCGKIRVNKLFILTSEHLMKPKRNPVKGPLLTFGLMIGSVLAVVAISRYFDTAQQKATPQTVQASANSGSDSTSP